MKQRLCLLVVGVACSVVGELFSVVLLLVFSLVQLVELK